MYGMYSVHFLNENSSCCRNAKIGLCHSESLMTSESQVTQRDPPFDATLLTLSADYSTLYSTFNRCERRNVALSLTYTLSIT